MSDGETIDPVEREKQSLKICHFPKYEGRPWREIVEEEEGRDYIEWLLYDNAAPTIEDEALVDYLEELLEGDDEWLEDDEDEDEEEWDEWEDDDDEDD